MKRIIAQKDMFNWLLSLKAKKCILLKTTSHFLHHETSSTILYCIWTIGIILYYYFSLFSSGSEHNKGAVHTLLSTLGCKQCSLMVWRMWHIFFHIRRRVRENHPQQHFWQTQNHQFSTMPIRFKINILSQNLKMSTMSKSPNVRFTMSSIKVSLHT